MNRGSEKESLLESEYMSDSIENVLLFILEIDEQKNKSSFLFIPLAFAKKEGPTFSENPRESVSLKNSSKSASLTKPY